ncbi:flagellar basal body-associated FliL family protein [Henriciella aquimarina]|uniref:flagellar basal body-associated FliL family protein n=1 Tax=Henriciella aquimarina TaxID=545261 RepID=UPI001301BDD5|nr:flagellar basal body-associated FliL family protein [Henriciella aquimarina]
MAAQSETENAASEETSGGGMMKFVLLAVVSAGISFAMMFLLTPSVTAESTACTPAATQAATSTAPLAREDQSYVALEEILITIGNEPATRYVKIKTSIIARKGSENTVKKAEPMLTDAFVSYLRSVELEDFETAGFYPRLREQLARRAELVLGGDVSGGVLITEFLLR